MPKDTFYNLKEEKRKRIIDAAISEFSTYTLDTSSINRIIKKSSIPRGSFYQYFDDIVDLYSYILMDIIGNEKLAYFKGVFTDSDNFFDIIEKMYITAFKFAFEHKEYAKVGNLFFKLDSKKYPVLYNMITNTSINYFTELIEKEKRKGVLRSDVNSVKVAQMIMEFNNLLVSDKAIENISYEENIDEINEFINILKYGILSKGD